MRVLSLKVFFLGFQAFSKSASLPRQACFVVCTAAPGFQSSAIYWNALRQETYFLFRWQPCKKIQLDQTCAVCAVWISNLCKMHGCCVNFGMLVAKFPFIYDQQALDNWFSFNKDMFRPQYTKARPISVSTYW